MRTDGSWQESGPPCPCCSCPPPAVPPAPTLPQFYAQLNRVPIPRRGPDGRWLYMQLRFRWSMVFPTRLRVWGPADESPAASAPVPAWQGGKAWAGVLLPHDAAPVSAGGAPPSTPPPPAPADAEAAANKLAGSGSADGDDSVLSEWLEAGWTAEEARLAATPEFQAEVLRDRHAKLSCFAETPTIYSRFWLAQVGAAGGAAACGAAWSLHRAPCTAVHSSNLHRAATCLATRN